MSAARYREARAHAAASTGPGAGSGTDRGGREPGPGADGRHRAHGGRVGGAPGRGGEPPPLRVPAMHFAAALAFFLLGAAVLVWRAPSLAAGAFSDPGVVAGTHLLTLGWISTSIMGVLHQLLPVALGAPVRWPRVSDTTLAAWTVGVAAFAGGLLAGVPAATVAGAGAVGLAVLLFVANMAATLRGSGRRGLTWWCVGGATVSLLGAWLLGFLLTVNLSAGLLGGSRFVVLGVHVHVAVAGWVLLTMIGVAHHMHPMFLQSRNDTDLPGRVAAALVAAGTAMLLLSEHLLPVGVLRPAYLVLAAGAVAFLLQAVLRYRHAGRPRLDPGMRLVAAALTLLGAGVAVGVAALALSRPGPRLLTAYGVLLIPGGLGLFVAGHYYRIVPFLTWFHRYRPAASEREVPGALELFDHRVALGAAALLTGGVATVAVGTMAGGAGIVRAGAAAFAAGALIESAQMLRILRRRPR